MKHLVKEIFISEEKNCGIITFTTEQVFDVGIELAQKDTIKMRVPIETAKKLVIGEEKELKMTLLSVETRTSQYIDKNGSTQTKQEKWYRAV